MNKTQKLRKLAEIILHENAARHLINHVEIEYGDCYCEYVERHGERWGYHLDIVPAFGSDFEPKEEAFYLGKSFDAAKVKLTKALEQTIRYWNRLYVEMSDGKDIPV
jgi:hypothetical protein